LAARLEALNKDFGTRILLSPRTAELVAGSMPLRDHGAVPVRGFAEPLRIFEPLAATAHVH
jgi:class 3 adenylate cyclase